MKNIKRLTCLVVAFLMIATCSAVFADFSDVPATSAYAQAVSSLSQLGVINGYEDGTFKPDNDVTRAEFTAMLMRAMGAGSLGSTSAADLPFTDISDTDTSISWAIPNINIAYSRGIINGYPEDNTFKPNNNILYEEAVKMVVCALGYGSSVNTAMEPWYTDYINQARTLTIIKNAQNMGNTGSPASRACIAQMLYDSLEVPLVEGGMVTTKTLLSDYLGYIKSTGYISANDVTSLDNPDVTMHENQIQIRAREPGSNAYEVHTYAVDNIADFQNKLGYQIDFFYASATADSPVRSLFSYEIKNNNTTLEIAANMIDADESTNSSIRYFPDENARLTGVNLAADNIVIYNGKLYGPNADSSRFSVDMLPGVGTVSLLDSDNNGSYDIVNIWKYDVYYVSSKMATERSITDNVTREGENARLYLDNERERINIIRKSGEQIDFGSIATGDVVCYAASNPTNGGESYATAVVVSDKVTGTVSSLIPGEDMVVNNQTYPFSAAAPWMDTAYALGNTKALDAPKASDSGTYVLDINGNVFAYSNSAETNANVTYGYLIAYDTGSNLFGSNIEDVSLRILSQNGNRGDYYIRRSTRVNGETYSDANSFINALSEGAGYQYTGTDAYTDLQQVIKFATSGNFITDIYTVTANTNVSGGNEIVSNKLYKYSGLNPSSGDVNVKYSNNRLTNGNANLMVESGTVVFVVPDEAERDNSDNFFKRDRSYFSNNRTYEKVEAFDVSTTNSARVVVVYSSSSVQEVDDNSPIMVVSELPGQTYDSTTGEFVSDVSGYQVSRYSGGLQQNVRASETSGNILSSMEIGDIYRVGEDSYGYMTFESKNRLYPSSGGYIDTGVDSRSNWDSADYCVIYGSVYASNSNEGMVLTSTVAGYGDDLDSVEQYPIPALNFSDALILRYDHSRNNTEIVDVTEDGLINLDTLSTYSNGQDPADVLIYMYQGEVQLMAIINE